MRAGDMDRSVTLSHRALARNTQGEEVVTYTTYATVWAQKIDPRGREFFGAQQVNAEVLTRFRLRHRTDVVLTDQLTCDGVAYDIQQVSEIGRKQGLELFGRALVP